MTSYQKRLADITKLRKTINDMKEDIAVLVFNQNTPKAIKLTVKWQNHITLANVLWGTPKIDRP